MRNEIRLYIIGNGFDIHHTIRSKYSDFGNYLSKSDRDTLEIIRRYFGVDETFWRDFEGRLGSIEGEEIVDDLSHFGVSYGAEDWSDSYHHDFQYEVDKVVDGLSNKLRECFEDWVRQLEIPARGSILPKLLLIDGSAKFLNFNYTASLQQLYDVPSHRITYIHGAAMDPSAKLI